MENLKTWKFEKNEERFHSGNTTKNLAICVVQKMSFALSKNFYFLLHN